MRTIEPTRPRSASSEGSSSYSTTRKSFPVALSGLKTVVMRQVASTRGSLASSILTFCSWLAWGRTFPAANCGWRGSPGPRDFRFPKRARQRLGLIYPPIRFRWSLAYRRAVDSACRNISGCPVYLGGRRNPQRSSRRVSPTHCNRNCPRACGPRSLFHRCPPLRVETNRSMTTLQRTR